MTPNAAMHDCSNKTIRDSVFATKRDFIGLAGIISPSDLKYLLVSELGMRTLLANWKALRMSTPRVRIPLNVPIGIGARSMAALLSHILIIVRRCSQEEMVRSDAQLHITVVTNVKSIGNRPIVQFPREAVSTGKIAAPPPWPELPIATSRQRTCPQPTGTGLVNVSPESFGDGKSFGVMATGARAMNRVTRWGTIQYLTALGTDTWGAGIMSGHDEPPIRCARPGAVTAAPWLIAA